jgi:aminomuconate-semialdehyde/2-hydroxymuconate-6-semialdehyde dehydrogenase
MRRIRFANCRKVSLFGMASATATTVASFFSGQHAQATAESILPASQYASAVAGRLPRSSSVDAQGNVTLKNFIGGEFVAPISKPFANVSPATGNVVCHIGEGCSAEVEAAVAAAQAAMDGPWSKTTVAQRAAILDRMADIIKERSRDLALLECIDTGKPVTLAASLDIVRTEENFRTFSHLAHAAPSVCYDSSIALHVESRSPVGVVALITPWNLPLYLLTWKVAPALVSGNALVIKPSELTPITATALAEIAMDAGLPPGVLNIVHGLGATVGGPLVSHAGVKAVSFTGGTVTGRIVAAAAAVSFKKVSLELGGKNPFIVFEDCDVDKALEAAVRAGYMNQGQICLCGSRLFVQRGIYHTFVARFVEKVKEIQPGDPLDAGTKMGALISDAHVNKVDSYVQLAKSEGGTILCGGARPSAAGLPPHCHTGFFYMPTVIAGLPHTCRTSCEEIFGPVVTVHAFDSEEEVVGMANHVDYGLAASVWSLNCHRTTRVAKALRSGLVWVNCWLLRDLRSAFGGVKQSGVGREGGRYSLEFFTEVKTITYKHEE